VSQLPYCIRRLSRGEVYSCVLKPVVVVATMATVDLTRFRYVLLTSVKGYCQSELSSILFTPVCVSGSEV
jgi:hypothetical protein